MPVSQAIMVTGSRDLADEEIVALCLNTLEPTHVIVGCCPTGADLHARLWCYAHGFKPDVAKADWNQHGRAAGPIRNAELVRRAVAVGAIVLAFPRGGSGTLDCMKQAQAAGLQVVLF
jgi:hypothetical protein